MLAITNLENVLAGGITTAKNYNHKSSDNYNYNPIIPISIIISVEKDDCAV